MAKTRTSYICERCGAESAQWHGKCLVCGEWNTLVEFRVSDLPAAAARRGPAAAPARVTEVEIALQERRPTGMNELDRVLGGGLVPGALILVAGDPGIGKSTLLLQAANSFAASHGRGLYVSGEESLSQAALRSRRLKALSSELLLLAENDVEAIALQVQKLSPHVVVVDSIQAMYLSLIHI